MVHASTMRPHVHMAVQLAVNTGVAYIGADHWSRPSLISGHSIGIVRVIRLGWLRYLGDIRASGDQHSSQKPSQKKGGHDVQVLPQPAAATVELPLLQALLRLLLLICC